MPSETNIDVKKLIYTYMYMHLHAKKDQEKRNILLI